MMETIPLGKGKKVGRGAFHGELNCPFCNHTGEKHSRWTALNRVGPFRIRYRCKDCKMTIQYDFSNNPEMVKRFNPYGPMLKNNRFRTIWDAVRHLRVFNKRIP